MNVIIADSRGNGLEDAFDKINPVYEKPVVIYSSGARINGMKRTALEFKRNHPNQDIHFIIMGGYCDMNERAGYYIQNRGRYEEFIFRESPESASSRVTSLFRDLINAVTDHNTKIVKLN